MLNAIRENTGGGTGSVDFEPRTRNEYLLNEIRKNTEGGGLPGVTSEARNMFLRVSDADNPYWGPASVDVTIEGLMNVLNAVLFNMLSSSVTNATYYVTNEGIGDILAAWGEHILTGTNVYLASDDLHAALTAFDYGENGVYTATFSSSIYIPEAGFYANADITFHAPINKLFIHISLTTPTALPIGD